ncbi:MAG: S41 family peptidase [Gemmatimonadota bacterium]|nr:S41 family peptidase [Gemmatimonadota bacterium]
MTLARLLVLLACAGCAGGCGTTASPAPAPSFVDEFDTFWTAFDTTYPYFEYKEIDWDEAAATFRPRAAEASSREELVDVLVEATTPMRDRHVTFETPTRGTVPTYEPDFFVNWDLDAWTALVTAAGWDQTRPNLGSTRLEGIPYIAIGARNPAQFTSADFDAVLERFRDDTALVLDVRPNGGGSDSLALAVAGRFADASRVVQFVQVRNGPDHSDLGPLVPRSVEPRGEWQFEGEVIVLAGRGSLSGNETFVAAMRELPHVTIVGDTTGGSSGNPETRVSGMGSPTQFRAGSRIPPTCR